ncbi:hypothetical protein PoB_003379600 [Plakobranchus ocellatus]|uniref:Integrase SAM-like N-terminal domain-containing protein n=1 Tax=Plakobranchus ocellatus TaxID=259542 RepID=A0AAV4AL43_9GAST|nr:hypothetical protein PoB_003379600 [Plakobranchus ocellatus]
MNHQNYAKYLSVYYIMLVNLPQQLKDLLQANGFSVSRSDTPAFRTAADMTIEQTINKHAKTSGGIARLSRSLTAYYRWCVTRHNRAQYVSATYQMANIESKKCETHQKSSLSKRKLSEKAVKKIMDTFSAFLNLFNTERKHLACISSGQTVPEDVADDLLKVEDLNITDLAATMPKRLRDAIIGLHIFTACDSTSCFAEKGKLKALKMLQGDQDHQDTFSRIGTLETI